MEQLFTIKRAARRLQVSEKFLRRLQRSGRLKVVQLGRAVRVPQSELERLSLRGQRQ